MTGGRCGRTSIWLTAARDAGAPKDPAINNQWLTRANFRPTAPRRYRRRRQLAVGALLLVALSAAAYGFAGDLFVSAREVTALRAERDRLSTEVAQLRTELAVESATRRELERTATDLNAEVAELKAQVQFLKARRAAGPGAG